MSAINDLASELAKLPGIGRKTALRLTYHLLKQAPDYLRPGGALVLEFGIGQRDAICALAGDAFPSARITVQEDFSGIPRMLTIET